MVYSIKGWFTFSRLLVLICIVSVPGKAAADPDTNWADLAFSDNPTEILAALRAKISTAETLNGRLAMLEDAEETAELKNAAIRLRLELLLLCGRTEDAVVLLDSMEEQDHFQYLGERLALTHGQSVLPEATEDEAVPGVSSESIIRLQEQDRVTPEWYAQQRGMLISAGLLFSPYYKIQPGTGELISPVNSNNSAENTVSIQLGAFSSEENANKHLLFLRRKGISGTIITEKTR